MTIRDIEGHILSSRRRDIREIKGERERKTHSHSRSCVKQDARGGILTVTLQFDSYFQR